ncbi:MAG: response regulator transcription factor [Chloroflexota bacterium]
MASKLLIVDDEPDLLAELKPLLSRSGYDVVTANNGVEALTAVSQHQPDLIILDMLMPLLDGRAVLRQLREDNNWTPVILLTQVNTSSERVLSLQEGADDYLNKPFDPLELLARIQAILRRTKHAKDISPQAVILKSDELTVNRQNRIVTLNGNPVELTSRAFDLLTYLMRHPHEVVSRDQLLDEIWGWAYAVSTRAVDMRIAEIRKQLNEDANAPRFVDTVVGIGYRFIGKVTVE